REEKASLREEKMSLREEKTSLREEKTSLREEKTSLRLAHSGGMSSHRRINGNPAYLPSARPLA
ncbi:MAG TPA: hypothetical protein VM328_09315, partial [Fimbriimonadaceae bacterium]|nr:hypothetical protein [Fimbriimonadaceae bacterium]